MKDLILDPARLSEVDPDIVLESAANAFIAVDHRFLHAILDRPEPSIPALVRFTGKDHHDDLIEMSGVLVDLFRHLRTPEAIPFLMEEVRRTALNIDDELIEAVAQFGHAALDPLLDLLRKFDEAEHDPGDILFLLTQLRVRDPRILADLIQRLESGNADAVLFLEMYGDPAAIPALQAALERPTLEMLDRRRVELAIRELSSQMPIEEPTDEPFDIWDLYPGEDSPPLDVLEDEDRLAMLESSSAELRAEVAEFYRGPGFSLEIGARLLKLAKTDPDMHVRGEAWQSLADVANEREMRLTMLGVLTDAGASLDEKGGVAVALALQTDNPVVFQAIEDMYADPRSRAKALEAMGHSFDRRFSKYPPLHLDDPDLEIKRQAIWGVGNLGLTGEAPRLEAFFDDPELRADALFAYAMSVPGENSRSHVRSLFKKIDDVAGGLTAEDRGLVEMALDQRLHLHGKKPVFSSDEPDEPVDSRPVEHVKVGRNDPCPCGSGKKYKKCCGA